MFNDLIALQYRWGHSPRDGTGYTDCFQLMCEVQTRLGLADYSDRFAWVYQEYTQTTLPQTKVARWLLECGTPIRVPRAGASVLLTGRTTAALGTATDQGVIFISPGGSVIHAPAQPNLRYIWLDQ